MIGPRFFMVRAVVEFENGALVELLVEAELVMDKLVEVSVVLAVVDPEELELEPVEVNPEEVLPEEELPEELLLEVPEELEPVELLLPLLLLLRVEELEDDVAVLEELEELLELVGALPPTMARMKSV